MPCRMAHGMAGKPHAQVTQGHSLQAAKDVWLQEKMATKAHPALAPSLPSRLLTLRLCLWLADAWALWCWRRIDLVHAHRTVPSSTVTFVWKQRL